MRPQKALRDHDVTGDDTAKIGEVAVTVGTVSEQ